MSDIVTGEQELTRQERFIRRLAAAHHSRNLGALFQWHPGQIDVRVFGFIEGATDPEVIPWALTAKAFALAHSGRRDVRYGDTGTGIGTWVRRLDSGPENAERLVTALTRAQDPRDLDRILSAIAKTPARSPRFSPHWGTVLQELTDWSDPTRRPDIAFRWARDFHTFTPAPVAAK